VRFNDTILKFLEDHTVFSLTLWFACGFLYATYPSLNKFFTEKQRAVADFRWVSMSLFTLLVVLWQNDYSKYTNDIPARLNEQEVLLITIDGNAKIFNAEWCIPVKSKVSEEAKSVSFQSYCEANRNILAEAKAFFDLKDNGKYQWHTAPMFELNNDLLSFDIKSRTDARVFRNFVLEVQQEANKFNRISRRFKAEILEIRTSVQLRLLRLILLHLTALFGSIRLMRAYQDIQKVDNQAVSPTPSLPRRKTKRRDRNKRR